MRALILVDIQNDFLPGGALAVPHGDEVIPVANALSQRFQRVTDVPRSEEFGCVIATQDWHPANHCSFAGLWPVHCVQGTPGADLASDLQTSHIQHVVQKGTDPSIDSYSGFFDNDHNKATDLHDYLRRNGVTEIFILGLATDYCVKATALDAVQLGYKTWVVIDGCRGVDNPPGHVQSSLEELKRAGVELIDSYSVP